MRYAWAIDRRRQGPRGGGRWGGGRVGLYVTEADARDALRAMPDGRGPLAVRRVRVDEAEWAAARERQRSTWNRYCETTGLLGLME